MFFFPILPVTDLAYFLCSNLNYSEKSLVLNPESLDFKNLGFVALGNIIDSSFNNNCFVQTHAFSPIKYIKGGNYIAFPQIRSEFFRFTNSENLNVPVSMYKFHFESLNRRLLKNNNYTKISFFNNTSLVFKRYSEFLVRTNEEIPTEIPLLYNYGEDDLNTINNFTYSDTLSNCFKYFFEKTNSKKTPTTCYFIVKCIGKNNYIFDMAKGKLYFTEGDNVTLLGFFAVKSENIDYVSKCIKTGAVIHKDALAFVVDEKVFNSEDSYVRNAIKILEKKTCISIIALNFEEFKNKINLPKVLGKQKLILDDFLEKVCEKFEPENNNLPFYLID